MRTHATRIIGMDRPTAMRSAARCLSPTENWRRVSKDYRRNLRLREALAAEFPNNSASQRNLMVAYSRMEMSSAIRTAQSGRV